MLGIEGDGDGAGSRVVLVGGAVSPGANVGEVSGETLDDGEGAGVGVMPGDGVVLGVGVWPPGAAETASAAAREGKGGG